MKRLLVLSGDRTLTLKKKRLFHFKKGTVLTEEANTNPFLSSR